MSARDLGAAHQIAALARHFSALENFSVHLAAMAPAAGILMGRGLAVIQVDLPPAPQSTALQARALLVWAGELLERIDPDAILVGLSGPDLGLDEALVAQAGNRPSYAFQDYWGDVNPGFGETPQTYFVLDEVAARLTGERVRARTVVAGSPRHDGVTTGNGPEETAGLLFCGQPLWHLEGYAATLDHLAAVVADGFPGPVRYRQHPRETRRQQQQALDRFHRRGIDIGLDGTADLHESLAGAGVVASCYSNCGLDLAYLNRVSPRPLAGIAYLMFEHGIRHYYRDYSGLSVLPMAELGLALEVREQGRIGELLERVAGSAWRRHGWSMARRMLPAPEKAAARIEAQLRKDLAGQETVWRSP